MIFYVWKKSELKKLFCVKKIFKILSREKQYRSWATITKKSLYLLTLWRPYNGEKKKHWQSVCREVGMLKIKQEIFFSCVLCERQKKNNIGNRAAWNQISPESAHTHNIFLCFWSIVRSINKQKRTTERE